MFILCPKLGQKISLYLLAGDPLAGDPFAGDLLAAGIFRRGNLLSVSGRNQSKIDFFSKKTGQKTSQKLTVLAKSSQNSFKEKIIFFDCFAKKHQSIFDRF